MESFKKFFNSGVLAESPKSDDYERDVADVVNKWAKTQDTLQKAERPPASTLYSDIKVIKNDGEEAWIEVKMNHSDNLANPRMRYNGKKWYSTSESPIVDFIADTLNKSDGAKQFIEDLKEFLKTRKNDKDYADIDKIKLSSNKTEQISEPNTVNLPDFTAFLKTRPNKYILPPMKLDLTELLRGHWESKGKNHEAPASYLQAKDDLYIIDPGRNPLNLKDLPEFDGRNGQMVVRGSIRSKYYEILPTLKLSKMEASPYSFKPHSKKDQPRIGE